MMKCLRGIALSIFLALASPLGAQRVIPLYSSPIPGSESWTQQEREYFSKDWQTQIVANVTKPTLIAYLPTPDKATGTAVTDDELGLAPQSVDLYSKWAAAKKPAELHMYSKGGHGFGMRTKGTPSDTWIERFGDWLGTQGLLKK